jgi:hypothetical protein
MVWRHVQAFRMDSLWARAGQFTPSMVFKFKNLKLVFLLPRSHVAVRCVWLLALKAIYTNLPETSRFSTESLKSQAELSLSVLALRTAFV